MRPPLSDAELEALKDIDTDLDAHFGRVFATPQWKALDAELERLGRNAITREEVRRRVGRMRVRWGDISNGR